VTGLTNVLQISCGDHFCCARKSDGSVWCWGYNGNGELGDDTSTNRTTPVQVSFLQNAVDIAAGSNHACAIRQNGTTWCWGYNGYGELGNGTATSSRRPVQMPSFLGAVSLAAGEAHTCAVMSDASVRCWGRGTEGQLGNNAASTQYSPVTVLINASTALTNVTQLDGGRYNCARLSDSTVRGLERLRPDRRCSNAPRGRGAVVDERDQFRRTWLLR
jgi:alpha-tubulin suppressor-like RCC1 family protein